MTMNDLDRWASCRPIIEPNRMKRTEYRAYSEKTRRTSMAPDIKDVIFSPPATIVFWEDGTKTVVKCQDDETYSKEVGLAMCICKKVYGNKGNYNNVFKKFIKEY